MTGCRSLPVLFLVFISKWLVFVLILGYFLQPSMPSDDKPHHWWAKWLLQLHRRREALCDVQRAALPPCCLVSRKGRGEPAAQNSARTLPLAHSTGGRDAKAGLFQQDRLVWLPPPTGQATGEPASWVWCCFYRAILQRPTETSMVKILHEIPKCKGGLWVG